MSNGRRPSGLMRQLDCLWDGVEELREAVEAIDPEAIGGEPPEPTDPGDITVYFENGLT